jgi:hypothetical protein
MKAEARSGVGGSTPLPEAGARRTRTVFIVGITGDGYVPLIEDQPGSSGRCVLLPSLLVDAVRPLGFEQLHQGVVRQLRKQVGYEVGELVPMGPRPLNGRPLTPDFVLAPLLEISDWRRCVEFVPGIFEVPLRGVQEWLSQRRLAGAIDSTTLLQGLLLAANLFPQWAQRRVCEALVRLRGRPTSAQVALERGGFLRQVPIRRAGSDRAQSPASAGPAEALTNV